MCKFFQKTTLTDAKNGSNGCDCNETEKISTETVKKMVVVPQSSIIVKTTKPTTNAFEDFVLPTGKSAEKKDMKLDDYENIGIGSKNIYISHFRFYRPLRDSLNISNFWLCSRAKPGIFRIFKSGMIDHTSHFK